jgi:hypothetical protein
MTNVGRFRCIWLCCSSLLNQSSSNCCFACAALPLSIELQGPAAVDAGSSRVCRSLILDEPDDSTSHMHNPQRK